MVVSVGIDVSKDKHDCSSQFGRRSAGSMFTVSNNMDGFHYLLQRDSRTAATAGPT